MDAPYASIAALRHGALGLKRGGSRAKVLGLGRWGNSDGLLQHAKNPLRVQGAPC